MDNSLTRAMVALVVKRAICDIKYSPERGLRNLVDMGLQFSRGENQRRFFSAAQTLLENEGSAYFRLAGDIVANVDEKRLMDFGLTLGCQSFLAGPKQIRKSERELGCAIPWMVTLSLDSETFSERLDSYRGAVEEGGGLGIHFWRLQAEGQAMNALALAGAEPESCFLLFCAPGDITQEFIDRAQKLTNIMTVVRYDDGAAEAGLALRRAGLMYSLCVEYGPGNIEAIESGELFYTMQRLRSAFSLLAAGPDCTEELRRRAYSAAVRIRAEQRYRTVPWELEGDSKEVGRILSEGRFDVGEARFDRLGRLCARGQAGSAPSVFSRPLRDILRSAYSKEALCL